MPLKRAFNGIPHLRVVDKWLVTSTRGRYSALIAFWWYKTINIQLNTKIIFLPVNLSCILTTTIEIKGVATKNFTGATIKP